MTDPDPNEDWLREGLAGAVPDPPGSPARARAARGRARRARRRTTLVAAAGVVATLAVVGVVSTTLGDGSGRDETATAPASPFDAPGCPEEPVDAQTQVGPDHVPNGALSVRLCRGEAVPIEIPRDALVTEVDEVAAAVNGLEVAGPDRFCTQELGPGFQLVFTYPDDTSVVASGGLYGCREVVVHGVERTGADVPWERFLELLQSQRQQMDPPPASTLEPLDCPTGPVTPSTTPLGRPQDLVSAVYCAEDVVGSGAWRRADIAPADLAALLTDMRENSKPNAGYVDCDVRPPLPRIVGITAWGDRIEVRAQCTGGWFELDARTNTVWSPGDRARPLLERLFVEAR